MSALTVAKKDFRDAIRSRTLLALIVLFAIFTAGGAYVSTLIGGLLSNANPAGSQSALDLIFALLTPASLLVPVIGLLAGYKAIAGERESGSLKFLLGLPHSRRDVVLGKVIGRAAVVTVAILIGFAVGIVAIYVLTDSLSPVNYLVVHARDDPARIDLHQYRRRSLGINGVNLAGGCSHHRPVSPVSVRVGTTRNLTTARDYWLSVPAAADPGVVPTVHAHQSKQRLSGRGDGTAP